MPLPDLPEYSTRAMRALHEKSALRTAVPRNLDHHINTTRASNFEAYLCQVVGVLQDVGCLNCKQVNGPWEGCVAEDGYFGGSCANCHYNSMDSRCSFRMYFTFRA